MTTLFRHDLTVAGGATLLIAVILTVVGRALQRAGAGPVVTRKIPHALCGAFAALAAFRLSSGSAIAVVLALATVGLALIVEKGLVPVPGVFDGTRARDYGLVGFAAGALVAVLAFWPDRVAIAGGVLVLGLADAGAALVGHRFGQHRVAAGGGVRTLEGSVVFVGLAFAVSLGCCTIGFGADMPSAVAISLFVALTTAAIELIVVPALDNLLITPWVALLLHFGAALPREAALHWATAAVFGSAIVPFLVRFRWLDTAGAIGGGLVAATAVALGGWVWLLPAAVFFAVTSVLTAYRRPAELAPAQPAPTEAASAEPAPAQGAPAQGAPAQPVPAQQKALRGLSQVMVNAALPLMVPVVLHAAIGGRVWFAVYIGGIAASIADSWASEVGRFSAKMPVSLRTWRRVPKGTSGAVSPLGTTASVLGALAVGGFGAVFGGPIMVVVGVAAGIAGSALDTLLGATVQGRFVCPACHATVEEPIHHGVVGEPSAGWRWVGNDVVNTCANLAGMLVAFLVCLIAA